MKCCEEYGLVAVKRKYVPEWLWRAFCVRLPFFGYLALIQPFPIILTRKPTKGERGL